MLEKNALISARALQTSFHLRSTGPIIANVWISGLNLEFILLWILPFKLICERAVMKKSKSETWCTPCKSPLNRQKSLKQTNQPVCQTLQDILHIAMCYQWFSLICQFILSYVGNQLLFPIQQTPPHHLPGVSPHSTIFLHDNFLLCVQKDYYGQHRLARNHVSMNNTISTAPGSMLPGVVRSSGEINAAFVRGDSFACCGAKCRCSKTETYGGGVAIASGRKRREKGGDYEDTELIQVGKQARDAGSCKELCSIDLIPGVRKKLSAMEVCLQEKNRRIHRY